MGAHKGLLCRLLPRVSRCRRGEYPRRRAVVHVGGIVRLVEPSTRIAATAWAEPPGARYNRKVMSSPLQDPAQWVAEDAERTERARRVAAMLQRWQTEDVSDEPEWDVDQVERMNLTRPAGSSAK